MVFDPSLGLLAGLTPGSCYIDMTSNSPATSRRVAEACRARGIEVLDAPASGRPPGMTIMAGGELRAAGNGCNTGYQQDDPRVA